MSQSAKRPSASSLLLYVFFIAYGIWQLEGPRELSTLGVVWTWGIIASGLLGLLLALLGRAVPATTPEEAAKVLLEQQQKLYGGAHEFRRVTAEAFEGLDTEFYESNRVRLEMLGFRYLGDVEDVTVANTWPRSQAVLRVMLGDGGTVTAAVYHLRIFGVMRGLQFVGLLPRKLLTIDVETELSNDQFVSTGNTLKSDLTAPFPGISKRRFPPDTPVESLLDRHREHLRDALAAAPGVRALGLGSLEDVLESQNRQVVIKSAHKARIGYIDERELKSVLRKEKLSPSEQRVVSEIRSLHRAQSAPTPPESDPDLESGPHSA